MKLTRVERWLLSNQCKILAVLVPDEREYYVDTAHALEEGYELEYERACQHVYTRGLSQDECKEVHDILAMHRALKFSYDQLDDKSGIEPYDVEFLGFDGNNEGAHMSYVRYVCRPSERNYEELRRGDNFNSHSPQLRGYRSMLAEWERLDKKLPLSKDDIIQVANAGRAL